MKKLTLLKLALSFLMLSLLNSCFLVDEPVVDEPEVKLGVREVSSKSTTYFACYENETEGLSKDNDYFWQTWHDCLTCAEIGYTEAGNDGVWYTSAGYQYSGEFGSWPESSYNGGNNNIVYGTFTDPISSYTYKTVKIGTQTWFAENLRATKYNDGTSIPNVTEQNTWKNLTTPAYCWYNNDQATYGNIYGALYNWYTVNTGKLCPTGWHVPTDFEWSILTAYLDGDNFAGSKMKEAGTTHWNSPNNGATNESGFTALPGGDRLSNDESFVNLSKSAYYWSSTSASTSDAWYRYLNYNYTSCDGLNNFKEIGISVRCLKN